MYKVFNLFLLDHYAEAKFNNEMFCYHCDTDNNPSYDECMNCSCTKLRPILQQKIDDEYDRYEDFLGEQFFVDDSIVIY